MHDELAAGAGNHHAKRLSAARPLRALSDLPGPRGWPVLGNLLPIDVPRLHTILGAWAEEFGSFYRFRIAQTDIVAIADAAPRRVS